jgi:hypothetical protein
LTKLEQTLREHGLEMFDRAIAELAIPSIRLRPAAPGMGTSRFGGLPRMRTGFDWPRRSSGPLTMMAQIALDELASAAAGPDWLRRSGTLTFFYDYDDLPWGDAPADVDAARILYDPLPLGELVPAETPADLAPELVLPPIAMGFERELTLPRADAEEIGAVGLTDEQLEAFDGVRESLAGGVAEGLVPVHRMFGHADRMQESFEVGAEAGCELMLQLSTDEPLGLEFGDDGRLYFLVPAEGSFEDRLGRARVMVEEA